MPPRSMKQSSDYSDDDYDPDTDTPDTSEADSMLDDALKGNGGGIGKISALDSAADGLKKYRSAAAKSMQRSTEDEE